MKKYSIILITFLSTIVIYVAARFNIDYLYIYILSMLIFTHIHKKNIKKLDINTREKIKKNSLILGITSLIIFLVLYYYIKIDIIYYSIFSSLSVSLGILFGAIRDMTMKTD